MRRKYIILALWAALLLGIWVYTSQQGRPPTVIFQDSLTALRGDPLAPLWLLAIYLLRPLLLLPVSLLTVATGAVFGAVWGDRLRDPGDAPKRSGGLLRRTTLWYGAAGRVGSKLVATFAKLSV